MVAGGSSVRAATVTKFQLRGRAIIAFYEGTDTAGCVTATTSLRFLENVTKTTGSPPQVTGPEVFLDMSYQDACTGDTFFLMGSADAAVHFTGDLDSATLQATVPVTDDSTGFSTTVNVNLSFTGSGDLQVGENKFKTKNGNTIVHEKDKFTTRAATGTGTINAVLPLSSGSTSYEFAQQLDSATLDKEADGNRTITKG
jgi:hypothetical protein